MAKNKVELIYRLAQQYDIPVKKVESIINFQFSFITKKIKDGEMSSIRLPYFGKFSVEPNRVKYLNERSSNNKRK
jgi:nucleoid DNA-binding protein